MAEKKAASLSASLLADKGATSAEKPGHSPRDSPRLTLTAIESLAEAAEDRDDETTESLRAERDQRLRHVGRAGAAAGRRLLRLRVLVPCAVFVMAAAGYLLVAPYVDRPRVGAGGAGVSTPVRTAPPTVASGAATTGPRLSGADEPVPGRRMSDATIPPSPATEPVAVTPQPPAAPTVAVETDTSASRAKIRPPAVAEPLPSRGAREGDAPSAAARAVEVAATAAKKGYLVQLYALRSDAAVRREWRRLNEEHADLFGGLELTVERVELESPKKPLYRLQAGVLESAAVANKLCERARRRKLDCIVVRP